MSMENTNSNEVNMNDLELFQALLEGNWDQIEDVKGFIVPPIGSYTLRTSKCEVGTNKDKTQGAINIIAEITGILELADPEALTEEEQQKLIGAMTGTSFMGTFGLSKFKETFLGISAEMGLGSAAQTIEAIAGGLDLVVTIGNRVDKERVDDDGKPRVYASWKTVILG